MFFTIYSKWRRFFKFTVYYSFEMVKVAVVKTSPETVLEDYRKVMALAGFKQALPRSFDTVIKLNLSWSLFFPACSSPPWQLDGVLKTLRGADYRRIRVVENKTVVTDPWKGARLNKWLPVLEKHGLDFTPLTEVEWVDFKPKEELLVLDSKVFPEGIKIPKMFKGTNILHTPTMKTHGHSTMTGALKNAFGGLLKEVRHHCHTYIHEVLVDLLIIQKEIHRGMFCVTDGTVCGDGAGPRTMVPKIKNFILASKDLVAVDAISARMMGFDPMSIKQISLSHDKGLGIGDPDQIDVVGEDISGVNYHFKTRRSPVVFGDQLFRGGFLEPLLFHTTLFNLCILGSALYHDYFWYPVKGKRFVKEFLKTGWGRLFLSYK